jgi:hypothetical protein
MVRTAYVFVLHNIHMYSLDLLTLILASDNVVICNTRTRYIYNTSTDIQKPFKGCPLAHFHTSRDNDGDKVIQVENHRSDYSE